MHGSLTADWLRIFPEPKERTSHARLRHHALSSIKRLHSLTLCGGVTLQGADVHPSAFQGAFCTSSHVRPEGAAAGMAPNSATHIRKRQYQPSITTFLRRDADLHPSSELDRIRSASLSPVLPAETQSSLLSVGMRVRKSVPEGYKTHKTLIPPSASLSSTAPTTMHNARTSRQHHASTRELQPFCGLHKTGGWATQNIPSSSAPAVLESSEDDDDFLPDLMMSQSTLASTQGSFSYGTNTADPINRKRGYEEDMEEDMDAFFDEYDASFADALTINENASRHTTRIKLPMRNARGTTAVHIAGVDDFDEASFLEPLEVMDVDDF